MSCSLTKLIYQSYSFFRFHRIFHIDIMFSRVKTALLLLVQSGFLLYIFSCLIVLARSSKLLNRNSDSGQPCLYLVLEEREPVFSIKCDVIIRVFIDALSQVEKFPTLLRVAFLKNQKWILNFVRSASIELFLWFFF